MKCNKKIIGYILLCSTLISFSSVSDALKPKQDSTSRRGLHGSFYKNPNFTKTILTGSTVGNSLSFDPSASSDLRLIPYGENFKSIRLHGYIIAPQDFTGTLHVNNIDKQVIFLDDREINRNNTCNVVNLKKNQLYKVTVEMSSDRALQINDLQNLKFVLKNQYNQETILSSSNFRNPQFGDKTWQKKLSKYSKTNLLKLSQDDDDDIDTDGDGITDGMEKKGYTIQGKIAVPWKDEYKAQGYQKFTSNPYQAHTAGDPYTDYEKAARDIPSDNGRETFHPLVAAYPSIKVDLERVIISNNRDLSNAVGSSSTTGNTRETSKTVEDSAGATAGWMEASVNFQHSESYTESSTSSHDFTETNDNTESINTAQAGFVNANLRYHNVGSGAIYRVSPTTNMVLGRSTLFTVKAAEDLQALEMPARSSYPQKGLNGIALNTLGEKGYINLNNEQLKNYIEGKESLKIETLQTDGLYAKKNPSGNIVVEDPWIGVKGEVDAKTSSIILDEGNEVSERKIAAKDPYNPEDLTPITSLGDALKFAYPEEVKEINGKYYYKGKSLNEEQVQIYTDKPTEEKLLVED